MMAGSDRYEIVPFLQKGSIHSIVYLPMESSQVSQIWDKLQELESHMPDRQADRMGLPALIAIDGIDWNRDLSPWPAEKSFRGGEDFGGGAPEFLKRFIQLIEETEAHILREPEYSILNKTVHRAVAGYSLAGLFALFAISSWQCLHFLVFI